MDELVSQTPADVPFAEKASAVLDLGMSIGLNEAFGLVAGRCSAAQAEALLRIREERLYLACTPTWRLFCPRYLHISGSQADRIIKLWQEFGPGIFEIRQFMRISAAFYRSIESYIKDGALHFNDEAIELDPQNAQKIAAIVAELHRTAPRPEKPEPTLEQRLAELDRRCDALVAVAEQFALEQDPASRDLFGNILGRAAARLQKIGFEQFPMLQTNE